VRSTDDLLLRPAREDDADAVGEVYLASRRGARMPAPVHTDDEVRSWLASRLRTDETWLAEVGGVVAGYARLAGAWLDDLYVAPSYAGQGVGTGLLDVAKALRPEGFCLWVFESNEPARRFYAARGLVELQRTDGRGNEEKAPDIMTAWPGAEPLAFLRRLVDQVDAELGPLLERRSTLTAAIQRVKPVGGQAGRDPERERQIALLMAEHAPGLGAERLQRILHTIITESLDAAGPGSAT
jgi:chorismate mutase/GNAT superfamily N-acetyltransferase